MKTVFLKKSRFCLLICGSLFAALLLNSCDSQTQKSHPDTNGQNQQARRQNQKPVSAQELMTEYLDTFIVQRDLASAYDYLSQADQKIKNKATFVQEMSSPGWEELFKKNNSYTLSHSDIQSDQAIFTVELKTVDLNKIFRDTLKDPELQRAPITENDKLSDRVQAKIKQYQDGSIPFPVGTITHDFKLLKEAGEWRVFLDLETKEKKKQALDNQNKASVESQPRKD